MDIDSKIRNLRKRNGLNQFELAEAVEVSVDSVRRWESGKQFPRADELMNLASVLHVTVDELLNGQTGKQTRLVVTYDWSKYEEGGIGMGDNGFELILGSQGQIGLKGAGKLTSREAMEEFLARVRLQLETAFEAQVKRGAIQLA